MGPTLGLLRLGVSDLWRLHVHYSTEGGLGRYYACEDGPWGRPVGGGVGLDYSGDLASGDLGPYSYLLSIL